MVLGFLGAMARKNKAKAAATTTTHPLNRYAETAPDFAALGAKYPSFGQYVRVNQAGRGSIDWCDYNATRELTRILLEDDYGVRWWIPDGQLCPTVTNRANYIHWIEDLLQEFPAPGKEALVSGVDIGTGASCIYPLLGASLLGWKFLGTDITKVALKWARKNIDDNPQLQGLIEIRSAADEIVCSDKEGDQANEGDRQNSPVSSPPVSDAASDDQRTNFPSVAEGDQQLLSTTISGAEEQCSSKILVGLLKEDEHFDFCMCNPPFFESMEEAGLNPRTACGGTPQEMVCAGGEAGFVSRLIADSVQLRTTIHWYTTMVGKKASLKVLTAQLWSSGVTMVKTTEFVQGRTSRWGLAWTFSNPRIKAISSSVVSGRSDGSFSFMLDGMNRQCSALDVLQGLADHLEARGATCQTDTGSFMITGTFPGDGNVVVGKRTRDDVLVRPTEEERNDDAVSSLTNLFRFKASLFQQSPGCLLVKAAIMKGEGSSSASSRLLSALENAEAELKERFSARVRQKL